MDHLGVNFKIVYKKDKPNGTMKKVLDVSLAKNTVGDVKHLSKKDFQLL